MLLKIETIVKWRLSSPAKETPPSPSVTRPYMSESSKPVSPPLSVGRPDDELSNKMKVQLTVSDDGNSDEFEDAQEDSIADSAATDFEDSDIGTSMPPAPSFKSVLLQFLKTFVTSGTDLYSMSSPAIMCNGISVLEYCAHYCDHPEILAAISKGESPLDRMLVVVQWYLTGLFGSYASRSTASGFERKPFNPILGERFLAEWADEGYGKTEMISEQVSHHPPTTAFYLKNETAGVHVNAFSTQKTRLSGGTSIRAEQHGNVFLYLEKFKEEYMITLPEIYVRGILTGAPFVELCGDVAMVSSSGYGVKMRFIPKPWFSGEYDQVEAVIFDTRSGKIHFDIWGKWSSSVYFDEHAEESGKRCHFRKKKDMGTGEASGSTAASASNTGESYSTLVEDHARKGPTLFNCDLMPKVPFIVKPISKQGTLESRRVWHPVAKALQKADYDAANQAKNKIENEQRALRRQRAENNKSFEPEFFDYEEFCFMPNVHKESDHLEEILSKLISPAPKMLVTKDEIESDLTTATSESDGSSSSEISTTSFPISPVGSDAPTPKNTSKLGYKGRWVFKNFAKNHAVSGEIEGIKKALEVDNERRSLADQDGRLKSERRMLIGFTCKKCKHRTHRTMSHHAYNHGIVLIECSGCQSRHLIADNLGWFKDTPSAARKVEEMTVDVGEIRRSLNLGEKESEGLIELLKE